MPWYAYVGFLVLGILAYYIVVDIKTRKPRRKRRSAEKISPFGKKVFKSC